MALVGQILPLAPAARGESRELGLVEMDFVARIGAVLSDQRIGGRVDGEARLVEVGERRKRGDRLLPVVDAGPARIASGVARPRLGSDAAAILADLEQFIVGLERLPHALAGIAERSSAIGDAAAGGVEREGQLSAMNARQAKLATTSRSLAGASSIRSGETIGATSADPVRAGAASPAETRSAATAPARRRNGPILRGRVIGEPRR